MLTGDHGPAVSGAHNTIVTARAGKDLISALVSGLLTIGPRFGGALDEAALSFGRASGALSAKEGEEQLHNIKPAEYVKTMKKMNQLVMGIGHKVKSVSNPDKRVTLVKEFAFEHFKEHAVLNYALEVERITTQKKANLILNVDGAIAACFVDMILSCNVFERKEVDEMLEYGCLNGLFVLGRSIGFIGHYIDQKRLKQPLYRHPWDDIAFVDA
jgi:ATP citrate (pro-S)-lyase